MRTPDYHTHVCLFQHHGHDQGVSCYNSLYSTRADIGSGMQSAFQFIPKIFKRGWGQSSVQITQVLAVQILLSSWLCAHRHCHAGTWLGPVRSKWRATTILQHTNTTYTIRFAAGFRGALITGIVCHRNEHSTMCKVKRTHFYPSFYSLKKKKKLLTR